MTDKDRIIELEQALAASLVREEKALAVARRCLKQWRLAKKNAAFSQELAAESLAVAWEATRRPR